METSSAHCLVITMVTTFFVGVDVGVVEGVEKVLEKMNKGEESEVAIQPGYAYGSKGDSSKGVPPNAEVTYIVTLKDFIKVNKLIRVIYFDYICVKV